MLIPLMLLTPLAFGLLLLLPAPALDDRNNTRMIALIGALATFVVSLRAAFTFDWSDTAAFQFVGSVNWVEAFGLTFSYGADSISLWLVLLTTFLTPLVVLGSFTALQGDVAGRHREFFMWLMVLEAAMIGTFIATDIIFFYICFEFTLVPMYFLIGIFGSMQRLRAARVFFLYTFTGSMLTFAGLLYVAWFAAQLNNGVWSFAIADLYAAARQMSPTQQGWVLATLLAGFAVKVPIFPVHTWLPLAHTEAPTAGSVILAGVLLKLGTYGLLRFALPMVPEAVVTFAPYIGVVAVIGILYTALICWVQKDIKKLIAYSSVSHLGFCVLGLFALNMMGVGGSILYMINHGLSTGALFLCVGMIYERFHTREMRQLNGLARAMPIWAFFMIFFCFASVALPGLNGFVSEFLTLIGAFNATQVLGPSYAVPAAFGMIFGAIYILYMAGKVVWGPLKVPTESHGEHDEDHAHGHEQVSDLNIREIATLVPLAAACLVLGFYPTPMLRSLEHPIDALTAPVRQTLAARAADPQPLHVEAPGFDTASLGVTASLEASR